MPVKREASYEGHWFAWVGDLEQLRRLAQTLEDLIKDVRQRELARDNSPGYREDVDRVFRPHVKWNERELSATYEGPPAEVLDEVDRHREMELIEFSAPNEGGLSVSMEIRLSRSGGVLLRVRGEPTWVRGASSELASQLDRTSPWWGWLRSWLVSRPQTSNGQEWQCP